MSNLDIDVVVSPAQKRAGAKALHGTPYAETLRRNLLDGDAELAFDNIVAWHLTNAALADATRAVTHEGIPVDPHPLRFQEEAVAVRKSVLQQFIAEYAETLTLA